MVITDEQRFDTINTLGFPYVVMPNRDRLVQEIAYRDSSSFTQRGEWPRAFGEVSAIL